LQIVGAERPDRAAVLVVTSHFAQAGTRAGGVLGNILVCLGLEPPAAGAGYVHNQRVQAADPEP
jgi:hypothetical protein